MPLNSSAEEAEQFLEAYTEGSSLSSVSTVAGLLQVRAGWRLSSIELYGVARLGSDSRTLLEASNAVYNDNAIFAGAGADWLPPIPGVRLVAQLGGSLRLTQKAKESGWDARAGAVTYHELSGPGVDVFHEMYSEAIYVRRHADLFASVQGRTGYRLVEWDWGPARLELSPLASLAVSSDLSGQDYNRFFELGLGPRLSARKAGDFTISLRPYYVLGTRWQRPTSEPRYDDFRVLLAGFFAF